MFAMNFSVNLWITVVDLVDHVSTETLLAFVFFSFYFQACRFGYTFQRGLIFDFPNDPNVYQIADQFMFGPAFLVSPVLELNETSRKAYVPKVESGWFNFWDAKMYNQTGYANFTAEGILFAFQKDVFLVPHISDIHKCF